MQLEFHQLERRWEHLRVRHPARQRPLLASLAESGQQTPIVVVVAEGQAERYVVIDGYKRMAALEQLGRDTVEAIVWPMSEAAAVLLERSLRLSEPESALEVGWLLAELERRFSYSLEELARRFDRSVSWVSRRLALVERLPEAIQQQVRAGKIAAQVAMRFLVPVARESLEDCQRMAVIFAEHHCDTREAGQLYAAWRRASAAIRKRILEDPALFFKVQRQQQEQGKNPLGAGGGLIRDLEMVAAILNRAHRRLARRLWSWIRSNANPQGSRSSGLKNNSSAWRKNWSQRKHRMLSQAQRTTILELHRQGVGKREIARVLGVSRGAVRKVLRSNSSAVPELQRPEKAAPYRQQILELFPQCKGNLARVHEELVAGGAELSYAALTAFCRRQGIGHQPPTPAGRYEFAPGSEAAT